MSERLLHGRRALVTGSVQGIGLAIAQELARQGCAMVINIASVHGLVASVHKAPYVAAKFGTETAIIEPQIEAPALQRNVGREEAIRDLLRETQPSLRTSLPAEIARLVTWLCDPVAHNMTGTAMPVDGGWTAQ